MERRIEFVPAFDKRSPLPEENYGIGSMQIIFLLIGELGVMQFAMSTGMYLRLNRDELFAKPQGRFNTFEPMGYDVGYHSPKPMYDGQKKFEECEYIEGGCYYDGSSWAASRLLEIFLEHGEDAIWKELEDDYKQRFGELK